MARIIAIIGIVLISLPAWADTHYVWTNALSSAYPYTSWATAATNIQAAVTSAVAGDMVLVTNGTYYSIGPVTNVTSLASNSMVVITNAITLCSVNGATNTIVNGNYPSYSNRCVYIDHSNAVVNGLTIMNGYLYYTNFDAYGGGVFINGGRLENCIVKTNRAGGAGIYAYGCGVYVRNGVVSNCSIKLNRPTTYAYGGGVAVSTNGLVQNCVINQNGPNWFGGGVYMNHASAIVQDCLICSNQGSGYGGGGAFITSQGGLLRNCLIRNNTSGGWGGAGVLFDGNGAAQNCTIVSNNQGGGIRFMGGVSTMQNCIVYFNSVNYKFYLGTGDWYNSCTTPGPDKGTNNITADPQFVDAANENYRLLYTSPCIDAGTTNVQSSYTNDFYGMPHWDFNRDGTNEPDMGCYEFYRQVPTVSPLYFTNTVLRGTSTTNQLGVWNSNTGISLTYFVQVSTNATNWLSTITASGTSTGEHDTILLTNDAAGQTCGVYTGLVSVMPSGTYFGVYTTTQYVDVTMLVYDQVVVSSNNVTNLVIRGTAATNLIYVTNSVPDSTNNYTVSTNQSWLGVAPVSGSSVTGEIHVLTNTVSAVGIAIGTYTGVVTIDSVVHCGSESFTLPSETVNVTMHVMELDRAPSVLTNSVMQGHDASTQTCTVWNAGPGELSYTISTNVSWLTVSPSSGTSTGQTAGATNTHTITYSSASLSVGTHAGTITVTADEGGSPKMIDVTLTVNVQAELGVSPGYLENTVMEGESPTNQTLILWNASDLYALGYVVSNNISWLNVSSNSGSLAASMTNNLTVTYDTTNLVCGTGCSNYSGTITITATNESGETAIGSPQNVDVSVTVCPKSQLRVSPLILTNAVMEGYDASAQSFEVWNGNGFYTLSYNISNNVPWLMTSVTSGTSTGEHDTIVVSFCTGGLEAGISNTTITVSADDVTGSPQIIDVTVRIKPLAVLSCNATGYTNTIRQGQTVADASFGIWNGSAEPRGVLNYQVTVRSAECGVRSATSPLRGKWPLGDSVADVAEVFSLLSTSAILSTSSAGWVSVSPMSGTSTGETDTITVSINPTGLSPGKYSGTITVSGVDVGTGWDAITSPREISVELTVTATEGLDFDGDGVSDVVVYHESSGNWYILSLSDGTSASSEYWAENFGGPGYEPVPGDYNGNGIVDLGVYRRSSGYWYARALASDSIMLMGPCGGPGYDPVCGDFNGDGVQDLGVYNERAGKWYVMTSASEVLVWDFQWGGLGLKALASDFDNDGCDDMAVYESSTGYWYIISVNGTVIAWEYIWGGSGFEPASGDYDGDGYADLATYHEGTGLWFITGLESGLITWAMSWGGPGFEPVVGDYDGDGRADVAIYYGGYWFIKTIDGTVIQSGLNWGGLGFEPVGM